MTTSGPAHHHGGRRSTDGTVVVDRALTAAKATRVEGWRHRPDLGEQLTKEVAKKLGRCPGQYYCFMRMRQGDRPEATVYLWRSSPEVVGVGNIVTEPGEFGVEEYNPALDEFNEQILKPSLASIDDRGKD